MVADFIASQFNSSKLISGIHGGGLQSWRRSPFWRISPWTPKKWPEGLQGFEIRSRIGNGFYREYPSGAFPAAASGAGQRGFFLSFPNN
jgi:hypothetical protein